MQATDMDFYPLSPSFSLTTCRRLIPHGTSCSLLHAVRQPLHSIQRSVSQRNFILAMVLLLLVSQKLFSEENNFVDAFVRLPRHAGVIRQSVALVSCICVTESYP